MFCKLKKGVFKAPFFVKFKKRKAYIYLQRILFFDKMVDRKMKKTFKNYLIFISLALAILLFMPIASFSSNAYAANYSGDYISISYNVYQDGKVSWALDFGLNTQTRSLKEEEKANYRLNIQLALQKIFKEKKSELQTIYNNDKKEEFDPVENITYTEVLYDQKTDSAGFMIFYKTVEAYKFYNNEESDQREINDNIFFTNQTYKQVFPFAKVIDLNGEKITLAMYYKNLYIDACKGLSIESKMITFDPHFIYDYASYSNRIKTNADLTYKDASGKYHYAWNEKTVNINTSIVMTKSLTTIKKGWWYVIGICAPLSVMGILIAIVKIKENKNKKQIKEATD